MIPSLDDRELLDFPTGAILLSVTQGSLRGLIARRVVPFKKLGRRVMFQRRDLLAFIEGLHGCSPDEARENLAMRAGEVVVR